MGVRIICTHKPPKNTYLLLCWNTNAIILDTHHGTLVLLILPKCYPHTLTLGAILDRIVQNITDDLFDPLNVNRNDQYISVSFNQTSMLPGRHLKTLDNTFHK